MLSKEDNFQQKLIVRAVLVLLTILMSKNANIEIVSPNLEVRVRTESLSLPPLTKLIEWFYSVPK